MFNPVSASLTSLPPEDIDHIISFLPCQARQRLGSTCTELDSRVECFEVWEEWVKLNKENNSADSSLFKAKLKEATENGEKVKTVMKQWRGEERSLLRLPYEGFHHISTFLPPGDKKSLSATCKYLRKRDSTNYDQMREMMTLVEGLMQRPRFLCLTSDAIAYYKNHR